MGKSSDLTKEEKDFLRRYSYFTEFGNNIVPLISYTQKIDILKDILSSLGANVNLYGECCGGEKLQNTTPVHSKRVENVGSISTFFKLINQKADETDSDYIVTVCSMCEKNIKDGVELSDLDVFAPVIGLIEFIGFLFGMDGCGDLIINDETKEGKVPLELHEEAEGFRKRSGHFAQLT